MPGIFVHQILTGNDQRDALDPGFLVLDNASNERPDWFEYWPIRRFLLDQPLDEDSFYGFLSPRFKSKTNLRASAVHTFVTQNSAAEVLLLSPSLHLTAYHWNVFAYGETVHPGLLQVADRFFRRIGRATDLQALVTHSRNEVYSNYIVAKPRFWRAWLEITEQLFAIAEAPDDSLGEALRKPTSYRGGHDVQMKVFIMERIATWLLARDLGFEVRVRDPFVARSRLYKLPGAIVCDALKLAYSMNRSGQYETVFRLVSRCGRSLGWLTRIAASLGSAPIRRCLSALSSYWEKAGKA